MKKSIKIILGILLVLIIVALLYIEATKPREYVEIPATVVKVEATTNISARYVLFETEDGIRVNSKDNFSNSRDFQEENYMVGDKVYLTYDKLNKVWTGEVRLRHDEEN